MKKLIASAYLVLALLILASAVRSARAQQPQTSLKKVPVHSTQLIAGKDLYREFCAACHGISGTGDGPAAPALKVLPADLTHISQRNSGKFPEVRVQNVINGELDQTSAHGSKDMPVWGKVFRHMGANSDLANVRVYNLVRYIEEIQVK